jgi:hypothetical protein
VAGVEPAHLPSIFFIAHLSPYLELLASAVNSVFFHFVGALSRLLLALHLCFALWFITLFLVPIANLVLYALGAPTACFFWFTSLRGCSELLGLHRAFADLAMLYCGLGDALEGLNDMTRAKQAFSSAFVNSAVDCNSQLCFAIVC